MDEINEAIRRVREHGNALKAGAPHQTAIGEDMLLVCEAAARPAMIAPPSPLVEQLQAKLAQADTLYRDLLTEHETLKTEHADLDQKYLELVAAQAPLPPAKLPGISLDAAHDGVAAQPGTSATDADPRNPNNDDVALISPIDDRSATDLLGDKPLTKAERKARDKAQADAAGKT